MTQCGDHYEFSSPTIIYCPTKKSTMEVTAAVNSALTCSMAIVNCVLQCYVVAVSAVSLCSIVRSDSVLLYLLDCGW